MLLTQKTNNKFKNSILHNTNIPLHRTYNKNEENNTETQNSLIGTTTRWYANNDYSSNIYVMSKNEFIENFFNLKFEDPNEFFDSNYIKNSFSVITNDKNNKNGLYVMDKQSVSRTKIPSYLTKRNIHNFKFLLSKFLQMLINSKI